MGYAFISYSSKDQEKANAIRSIFLNNNISCWMAPYDIPAGTKYAFVINDAIKDAACLVLLFTNASQQSIFVEKEVERAVANGKPIITMELERVVLNSGYQFYLGNQQIIATPKINEDDENFQRALQGIAAFTGRTDTLKEKTQFSAANETATVQNAEDNKKTEIVSVYSNPRIVEDASMESGQKVTWDCIWFGSYPQSEVACETNTGRISELESNDNQYAVVSSVQWDKIISAEYDNYGDAAVDGVKYRCLSKTDADVTWAGCTVRSWLNGYDSSVNTYGIDYSNKNFINTAFRSSERSAIKTTEVINDDNIIYGTEGCYNTSDKIFLLSENEVCNSSTALPYGFVKSLSTDDEARRCKSSTYAKAMGVMSCSQSQYLENCFWWLRSLGVIDEAAGVDYDGSASGIYSYAGTVNSDGSEDNL